MPQPHPHPLAINQNKWLVDELWIVALTHWGVEKEADEEGSQDPTILIVPGKRTSLGEQGTCAGGIVAVFLLGQFLFSNSVVCIL